MNLQFSLYLDIIRFLAAILVVISHANVRYLSTEILPLSTHGHLAVMFFFVLSGFVIAFVTDKKENRFSLYWSSRISRIYSVALPVVLLTPIIDILGISLSEYPVIYADHPGDLWQVRIIASLFFLNETWFFSIMSFSNTPYWSLCYEMAYYLIFSLAYFLKGTKRILIISLVCLIVGPKILLLFPIWLMGVYLYYSDDLKKIGSALGWFFFMISTVLIAGWEYLDITNLISGQLKAWVGSEFHEQLAFSKYFLGDWILGLLIVFNFAGFRAIAPQFSWMLDPFKNIIRYLASFTLTLYLFHQPLIQFYAALISGEKGNSIYFWQTIIATLITIYILAYLTERRRESIRQWLRTKLITLEEKPMIARLFS